MGRSRSELPGARWLRVSTRHAASKRGSPPFPQTAEERKPWRSSHLDAGLRSEVRVGVIRALLHQQFVLFLVDFCLRSLGMVSRLLPILQVLLVLERSGAHLHGGDAPPDAERRVFTHESPDPVHASMFRLYERYSKEPQSRRSGNTVRSFRAVPGESRAQPTQ